MDYDPVKDRLGHLVGTGVVRIRLFFLALHLVFLRSWYVRVALRRILERFAGRMHIDVLDAGTGFGQYADLLVRADPRVRLHAVDVKEDYLNRLRTYIDRTPHADRVTTAVDDLTDLRCHGPFDVIVSVDVMEHIEDDRAVLRHFARVLRPGGVVVINTPSDRGGSAVSSDADASFIGEHVRDGYGTDEIREKLADAGLQTEAVTWTYGPAGSAAWRLLVQFPMHLLGRSILWLPFLVLYYLPVLPLGLLLNAMDVSVVNEEGTGLLVVARKPA